MSVSRQVPRNAQRGGLDCCSRHAGTRPAQARPERPDFKEPGIALGRFNDPQLLPGYGQASGLRAFMYTTAVVYATDRATADAFADANQLRGPLAREYHDALGG
jgi:hypothetical protein